MTNRFRASRSTFEALGTELLATDVGSAFSTRQGGGGRQADRILTLLSKVGCVSATRSDADAVVVICVAKGIVGSGSYWGLYFSKGTPAVGPRAQLYPLQDGWSVYRAR